VHVRSSSCTRTVQGVCNSVHDMLRRTHLAVASWWCEVGQKEGHSPVSVQE